MQFFFVSEEKCQNKKTPQWYFFASRFLQERKYPQMNWTFLSLKKY